MSVSFSEAIIYFTLVISTFYQVNGQNISIIRGKHDVFTNLARCNLTKAVCFDTNCTYCQCERTNETFIRTRGNHGECVPNEYLVYVTSYNSSFLVQDTTNKLCLDPHIIPKNRKTRCVIAIKCNINARSHRWLWTKNGQLLNLEKLECITVVYFNLLLRKCDVKNTKQLWKCGRNDTYYIWNSKESKGYLHYPQHGNGALKWKRYGSNQTLCSEAVGCKTFQDGSSLLILNQTRKCQPKLKCSEEKEINVGNKATECSLLPNQVQYLHKDGWTPLLVDKEPFNIVTSKNKTLLKWNLIKTPASWKGLIVKVRFQCKGSEEDQNNNEEVHCILIKYTGFFTGFDKSDGSDKQSDNKKDKPQTTVIIVCVLVIALIIGIAVFLAYRNKNRLATLIGRNTQNLDITRNASPGQRSGVSNNPVYRSNDRQSAQNECELYEATKPEPVYQYAYAGHGIEAQLPPIFTYDYALPDDHIRIGQRTRVGGDRNPTGGNEISQNAPEVDNRENASPVYYELENNNQPSPVYYVLENNNNV